MGLRRSPSKGKSQAKGAHVSTRIYKRDEKEFFNAARVEFKGNMSDAARVLISEALTTRRLRGAGLDQSLTAVKDAQKEVLSGELTELKNGVAQALSVLRRLGTVTDSIRSDSRQALAALEVVLGSVMHVQDMGEKYLLFPALRRGGNTDEQIFMDIKEGERQWRGQARAITERAKREAEDEF